MEFVSVCHIANARLGREALTGTDFCDAKVPMLSGCELCHATLGPYNAYPSTSGFIRCDECIGSYGFVSVEQFDLWCLVSRE